MIPTRILGPKATTIAHNDPWLDPSTGMKGENTKERGPGAMVLLIRLNKPKSAPKIAPDFHPINNEAMITGI